MSGIDLYYANRGVTKSQLTGRVRNTGISRSRVVASRYGVRHSSGRNRILASVDMARNQLDLFGAEEQSELFDEDAPTVYYHGDPDRVRARLHRLIAEARGAETLPWDQDSTRLYRKIVPQMVL